MNGGAVHRAREKIRAHLAPTPLREALGVDPTGGLSFKLESVQPTGSFKVRGAFSKLIALGESARKDGVIAASTGNHGAAVAYAARSLGVRAEVVVPVGTPPARVRAIECFGALVREQGVECGAAEAAARVLAEASGAHFVSPYNDEDVMHGQGTLALELIETVPDLDRVYVAVGGGGLVGGIALGLAEVGASVEVVGCSPEASWAMEAAVRAGEVVDVPHAPTLSLATAGALERDTLTLPACAGGVDRWLRVGEDAIAAALKDLFAKERLVAEGAVGVALGAWSMDAQRREGDRSCVIVCGGNLDPEHLFHLIP